MAKMNKKWQKLQNDKNVEEYFCQGTFIQSDTWNATSPPEFENLTYPYLKDGFSYNGISYTFENEIHVTEMTHATSFESMLSIIGDGGFRSNKKYCPDIGAMSLVWFGLKIEEREIDRMKEHSKFEVQRQLQGVPEPELKLIADNVLDEIARTPAFQPLSLHGNCKFTFWIQEVMNAYTTQFCYISGYPEMRQLGTFIYKQEIMHAILVCPPNTHNTDGCPRLLPNPVFQHDDTLYRWTWKPHSTGNRSVSFHGNDNPSFGYIRWEHVSFAFYVPEGYFLHIPRLEQRVSLCLGRKGRTLSFVSYDIMCMLEVLKSNVVNMKSKMDTLIRMIAGYLKDERLYEKTMVKNSFETHVVVDLESVVQRARQLLTPREFIELDWEPLNEWMKLLTRHSNVLRDIQRAEIRL